MKYRYFGKTGMKVSVMSWGNWVNTKNDDNTKASVEFCYKNGVNFFDTAESYGFGEGEIALGKAFKDLGYPRESYILSTKIFLIGTGLNQQGLSRKRIVEGAKGCLKRLQTDYADIIYCHRFDPDTDLEEVCRSMNWIIDQGYCLFWGTSEWEASQITEAYGICDRLGLRRPVAEQCQYNLIFRRKMEDDYGYIFDKHNMATTTWSPLFSGVLTGKYLDNPDARGRINSDSAPVTAMMYNKRKDEINPKLKKIQELAKELGCSMAQLAVAWVIKNPNTTTCILGSSKTEQLKENFEALKVLDKLTPEVEDKIEEIMGNAPEPKFNWKTFALEPLRRKTVIAKASN